MSRLTKAEREWIEKLQAVLDECPSDRLGFYTIGDRQVMIYNKKKQAAIDKLTDAAFGRPDFCNAVEETKADLGVIDFPSNVHSTAG